MKKNKENDFNDEILDDDLKELMELEKNNTSEMPGIEIDEEALLKELMELEKDSPPQTSVKEILDDDLKELMELEKNNPGK